MVGNRFIFGILSYRRAHGVIKNNGLWRVIIIPGIISFIYLPLVVCISFFYFKNFNTYLNANWVPEFLKSPTMGIVLSVILWGIVLIIGFLLYRNMIMILYSPILGYLSEKTDKCLDTFEDRDFNWTECLADMTRGILMSIFTLSLSIIVLLTSCFLIFIPIVGSIISGILLPIIQFYLAGWSFADPTLERKRYSVVESFTFSKENKALIIGLGCGFTIMLLIPLVGWFLAPSYGVIAGTICVNDVIRNKADLVCSQNI